MKIKSIEASYDTSVEFALFLIRRASRMSSQEKEMTKKVIAILFGIDAEANLSQEERDNLELHLRDFHDSAALAEWQVEFCHRTGLLLINPTNFEIGKATLQWLSQLPD